MKKHGPNLMIRRKYSQGAENSFPNIYSVILTMRKHLKLLVTH